MKEKKPSRIDVIFPTDLTHSSGSVFAFQGQDGLTGPPGPPGPAGQKVSVIHICVPPKI